MGAGSTSGAFQSSQSTGLKIRASRFGLFLSEKNTNPLHSIFRTVISLTISRIRN
jgi:hypothetical protein